MEIPKLPLQELMTGENNKKPKEKIVQKNDTTKKIRRG